jgi:ribose transport system substrate-binding protein
MGGSARHGPILLGMLIACLLAVAACEQQGADQAPSGQVAQGRKASAEMLVKERTAAQTSWKGPTQAPTPVKGKTIGIIPCGLAIEGCARLARGAEEAAKAIGWTPVVVDGQGNPQAIQTGMDSLINRRVDAIVLAAVNAQDVGVQLQRAKAQRVRVIGTFAGEPGADMQPNPWIDMVGIDDAQAGRTLAAYVVANGGGGVAIFTQDESPRVAMRASGFEAGLKEFGEGSVKVVERRSVPNTQLGPPEEQIMSALLARQPKDSFQWVYAGFDFMITPLIQSAERLGRTELKGLSFDGNLENLEFIREGRIQAATVGYPLEWAGWACIDQLNRSFQGQPVVEDPGIEFKLLAKQNLPAAGNSWTGDLDFRAEYRKLWGIVR